MSKERARKRAEERARRHAPKTRGTVDASDAGDSGPRSSQQRSTDRKSRQLSAREARRRRRIWLVAGLWVAANALIFLLTDTWNARWLGLTVTTILVPVIVWLAWDPEGRVDL